MSSEEGTQALGVSREPPPPLPGGWKAMDPLYYKGESQTFDDGDKLVHGQQGEVAGSATLDGYVGKGVAVLFPGNKDAIDCYLTTAGPLLTYPVPSLGWLPAACPPPFRCSPSSLAPVRQKEKVHKERMEQEMAEYNEQLKRDEEAEQASLTGVLAGAARAPARARATRLSRQARALPRPAAAAWPTSRAGSRRSAPRDAPAPPAPPRRAAAPSPARRGIRSGSV